jgi:hypothetical protein
VANDRQRQSGRQLPGDDFDGPADKPRPIDAIPTATSSPCQLALMPASIENGRGGPLRMLALFAA